MHETIETAVRKIEERAFAVGFRWTDPGDIAAQLVGEARELQDAVNGGDTAEIEDEIGDVLIVAVRLARRLGISPRAAFDRACAKVAVRLDYVEQHIQDGAPPGVLWQRAKAAAT